ncbi:MAG: UDP-2,4-diacetamido-2,4,6-trideoxy-beta-L-altropyranose hydrolase [Desulfobacterales bacterium]|nr:UDP-2,4-diacetamido-2,4,6-trideoxy-beta-L-altropyranose hydrolase [Desulfobacterales bacterium]MDP6808721.1 UDP-2,4-diacetamido-2,4,6-trideoxy-beta-L-altropyranose hydrolase [Desulfobacterales bacterium]
MRWTVDEPEDLEFVRQVFEAIYPVKPDFTMKDVLDLLERQSELMDINSRHSRRCKYEQIHRNRIGSTPRAEAKHEGTVLFIRTDANRHTGIGHFMRCLALGQAYKDTGGDVVFLGHFEKESTRKRIEDERFQCISLEKTCTAKEDAQCTLDAIRSWKGNPAVCESMHPAKAAKRASWVVIDGYHFDTEFQQNIKTAGFYTVVIDDNAHMPKYHGHIIVNQNIYGHRLHYACEPETVLLLGSDYALLRREFRDADRTDRRIKETVRNILITFGGVDSKNQTGFSIDALNELKLDHNFTARIIIGPENSKKEQLEEQLQTAVFDYELLCDESDMHRVMMKADIVLSAAGSTCWELCFMGVPSIVSAVSENQIDVADTLKRMNIADSMGWWQDRSRTKLRDAIHRLIRNASIRVSMSRKAKQLIDGKGVWRILNAMVMISEGISTDDITLREAEYADSPQLYQLANNPVIRQCSFHPETFNFRSHDRWYQQKLSDPQRTRICLLEYKGLIVAQARYDRVDERTAEIDFSVHPTFQEKGLGAMMLKLSVSVAGEMSGVDRLRGIVFESNLASQRCFSKADYRVAANTVIKDIPCLIYERTL